MNVPFNATWFDLSPFQRDLLRTKLVDLLDTEGLCVRFRMKPWQVIAMWCETKLAMNPVDRAQADAFYNAFAFCTRDVRAVAFEILVVGRTIASAATTLSMPELVVERLYRIGSSYIAEFVSLS